MTKLDPKYADLPDYILKITKEIWEDRGIATLNHHYSKDIVVRLPEGVSIGNQKTINATLATLAEFPDRQLTGEDVIWSGDDEAGFFVFASSLNNGDSHGAMDILAGPTGKRFYGSCHSRLFRY